MCGRYIVSKPDEIYLRFDAEKLKDLYPNYNVAPSYEMPVVTRNSPNKVELMKWGLIPFWAKDPKIGFKMINARAEGIADKPSFRKPFKSQRCLVPADGFYEWKKTKEGKVPYLIRLKSGELFAFAGLYDEWQDAEGKSIKSYTIITCPPNSLVEDIHNRMPVILKKDDEDIWLDKDSGEDELLDILNSFPAEKMEAYTVSTRVNSPRNNDKDLVIRVK